MNNPTTLASEMIRAADRAVEDPVGHPVTTADIYGWAECVGRIVAFAFGPAPEWERANATLKHRVRELEAALQGVREEHADIPSLVAFIDRTLA